MLPQAMLIYTTCCSHQGECLDVCIYPYKYICFVKLTVFHVIFFLCPYISGDSRLKFPCATIGRILTLCRITMYPPTINHHCWLYHWFYKTRTPWFWVGFHCLDPMRVFPKSQYIYIYIPTYPNLSQPPPLFEAGPPCPSLRIGSFLGDLCH